MNGMTTRAVCLPSPQPSPSREKGPSVQTLFCEDGVRFGSGPQTALFQPYSASSITQTLTLPPLQKNVPSPSAAVVTVSSRLPKNHARSYCRNFPEADRLLAVITIRQHHNTARVLLSPAAAERNTVWMIEKQRLHAVGKTLPGEDQLVELFNHRHIDVIRLAIPAGVVIAGAKRSG